MKCTNCGARVPSDAGACPECGVFVRVLEPKRVRGRMAPWILGLLLIAVAVAATTYFLTRPQQSIKSAAPLPVRVVHGRPGGARVAPGAKISEPEAILRLQRSFNLAPDCVAIMSKGYHDGTYDLVAVNRCDGTRLGRWRVDGKSGSVRRSGPA